MNQMPESIAPLIADLRSPDEFVRSQAAFALAMLGEPAVLPLIELLSHGDRDTRRRAAWALGVIGQPALPALLELSKLGDSTRRIEAIRVLGVIGEGRALNALFMALTDPNPHVAQRAAIALGRIGDPRSFHPLMTALRHPSADVRYAVCNALGYLHIPDAAPTLREHARDDDGITSWGASVAEAALRAADEIAAAKPSPPNALQQVSELLRQHQL